MKAEEIIDNIQKEGSMGPYEYLMFDECVRAMHEYARIQIEKDRGRVKSDFKPEHFCDDYHYNMVQNGIDLTPIILD